MPVQNVPVQGKPQPFDIQLKSFITPANPTTKDLAKYEKEINEFLKTIDLVKRRLNGRNSYAIGNKAITLIWYLETLPDKPVATKPFGDNVKPAKPIIIDDKNINPKEKKD